MTERELRLRERIDQLQDRVDQLETERDLWKDRAEAALANTRPLPHFLEVTYTRTDAAA